MAHRPRFVDRSPQVPSRRAVRGGALLRSGEAGVGKSVLLDTAAYWVVVAGIPLRSYRGCRVRGWYQLLGLHQTLTRSWNGRAGDGAGRRRRAHLISGASVKRLARRCRTRLLRLLAVAAQVPVPSPRH